MSREYELPPCTQKIFRATFRPWKNDNLHPHIETLERIGAITVDDEVLVHFDTLYEEFCRFRSKSFNVLEIVRANQYMLWTREECLKPSHLKKYIYVYRDKK